MRSATFTHDCWCGVRLQWLRRRGATYGIRRHYATVHPTLLLPSWVERLEVSR